VNEIDSSLAFGHKWQEAIRGCRRVKVKLTNYTYYGGIEILKISRHKFQILRKEKTQFIKSLKLSQKYIRGLEL